MERRHFLQVGGLTLSAATIALLGGKEALASKLKANEKGDVTILNVALALENEAIAAYQLGAESKLLTSEVLRTAILFQSHHKEHSEALAATIKKLGGSPIAAKTLAEYAKDLNAVSLKSQEDILNLAAKHEKGAANAYLGVIPSFSDKEIAKVGARIAADEVMHWTILSSVLKQELPSKSLSFGA